MFCTVSYFAERRPLFCLVGKDSFAMPSPKIRLPYSTFEKLLQILSLLAVAGLIVLTVFAMTGLLARIPTHFGADGRPDGWGGKDSLLLLPIVAAVLYVPLTILERFPWIYNYAVDITEENAARQYRLGRQMLEWMKLITAAIFFYLQWQTIQAAKGLSEGLGVWFLPVSMFLLFGVMGALIYRMAKCK